jgi:hypothetical protein
VGVIKTLLKRDEAVAAKNSSLGPAIADVLKTIHSGDAATDSDLLETTLLLFATMDPNCK